MKKASCIILLLTVTTLISHSHVSGIGYTHYPIQDSTKTNQNTDSIMVDTLKEVEVKGKGLTVINAINKSLNNGLVQPGQKSISDVLGSKTNDYIMHPFAWRERRKEKNMKEAQKNMKKLEAAKTYEDELTEAIYRQLREDSIAAAKKKMGERK